MILSRLLYYLSSLPTLLGGVRHWPGVARALLRPRRPPFVVELKDGTRLTVRTPLDVWIVKETCLERQYERASVTIEDGWTVLDIGAGLGDFAISVARRCPRSAVIACEPFPPSFALLEENIRLNGVANVRPLPCALGERVGTVAFPVAAIEAVQQSTMAPPDAARETVAVASVTLEHLLAQEGISRCDYVKMDCEGAEYGILFATDPATLRRIRHICLEVHEGVTEYSRHDLVRFFERNGFRVRLTPNPAWRHLALLHAAGDGDPKRSARTPAPTAPR